MFFLIRYVLCTLCSLARQLLDVEGNTVWFCYLFHLLPNSYCCNTNTAINQLRFLLAIPLNQIVIFERFSDSAGAYTTLDSNNPSVYKQLYRAAKAKLKLRIKATLVDDHPTVDPTTTGAAQETSTAADCLNPQRYDPAAHADRTIIASQPAERTEQTNQEVTSNGAIPKNQATESRPRQSYDQYLNSVAQSSSFLAELEKQFGIETRASVAPGSSASAACESLRQRFFSAHIPGHMRNVNVHSSYSVFCNECDHAIPGAHYHCSICDDGDFDLCQSCVDSGVLCGGEGHWLIKRIVKDGKVINSTTETIAPKATKVEDEKESFNSPSSEVKVDAGLDVETRTCNSCVGGE